MPDPNLYEVTQDSVIQAEDTNQLVRAVRDLQSHRESDPAKPFEGDVHFNGSTDTLGSLTHQNTVPRAWALPDQSGTLALQGSIVLDHDGLNGLEGDDHPQYLTRPRAEDWLEEKTTDDLSEGTQNLYYTNARMRQALGANSPLAYNSANGVFSMPQAGPGQSGHLSAADWSTFDSKAAGTHDHEATDITSGTLAVEHGGTGLSAAATGDLLYGSAEDTLSALPGNASTTRKFLSQSGDGETPAAPAWQGLQSSDLPSHDHAVGDITSGTLAVEHGGTGLSTAATGDLLYGSAEDTLSALPGNASTTRKFLSQSGDGETPAAPAWQGLQSSDLPIHDHAVGDITSGTLAVEHGGTGLSTAATGDLLYGSAEDTLSALPGNASTINAHA